VLLLNAVTHQVAQGVNGGIGYLVIHRGATPLPLDKALLHEQRQVPRHVGRCVTTGFGQFAHVVFVLPQQIENAKARGLSQRLKIGGNTVDGLFWHLVHANMLTHISLVAYLIMWLNNG
jgi:hypothetical protein